MLPSVVRAMPSISMLSLGSRWPATLKARTGSMQTVIKPKIHIRDFCSATIQSDTQKTKAKKKTLREAL